MSEPIENLYFNWLCAKIIHVKNRTPSLTYDRLLRLLHKTEFVFLISGDDNRAEDGLALRERFGLEVGVDLDPNWERYPCSVLEMLIAFSSRAEFATDERSSTWFWEFLENLGLTDYTDATYIPESRVLARLEQWMWRQYDWKGNGGLFPIRDAKNDQTTLEIWYQFCDYLVDQDRLP